MIRKSAKRFSEKIMPKRFKAFMHQRDQSIGFPLIALAGGASPVQG